MGNNQDYGQDIGYNLESFDPKLSNHSSLPFNIKCVDDAQYHPNWVTCVASLGDLLISGSKDCILRIYSTVMSSRIVKKQRPTMLMNNGEKRRVGGFLFVRESKKRLKLEFEVKLPYRSEYFINNILPVSRRMFLTSSSSFYENSILWELKNTSNEFDQKIYRLKKIRSFTHLLSCTSMCLLSRKYHIFAGGSHKEICVWNWKTGHRIRSMNGHKGYILSIIKCQNPKYDHLIISAGGRFRKDYSIRVWNWKTGEMLRKMEPENTHTDDVNILSSYLHPKSGKETLLSGGKDGLICSWDLERCRLITRYITNSGIGSEVTSILVYNHNYFLSCGLDRKMRLWDSSSSSSSSSSSHRKTIVRSCVMVITEFHQSWNSLSSCWEDDETKDYFLTGCDGSVYNRVRLWKFVDKEKEGQFIVNKYNEKRRARFSQKYLVKMKNVPIVSKTEFLVLKRKGAGFRTIISYRSLLI